MNIIRPVSKQPIPPNAKLVFKGKIFDTFQWQQKMFDGSYTTFEKIKRVDTAMIIPITEKGEIILTEEEQPGKEISSDFIGGRVDPGEDPLTAAKRELLEESGYKSDGMILWDSFNPTSKVEWVVYIFIARNCKKVQEPKLDPGEKISLKFLTFEKFIDLVFAQPDDFREVVFKLLKDGVTVDKNCPAIKQFKNLLLGK